MKTHISFLALAAGCLLVISACQKTKIAPTPDKTSDQTKTKLHSVAVAEADVTITLPDDSVQLTGQSGTPGDTVVGYLWSQISGPNEATIINESSQSAWAKKLAEGTYLFQFMVIDKGGSTGIDTLTVTVKPSDITTLDLSPANNPGESNIAILGSVDASNHTSIEEPLAAWTINGVPFTVRNLLKFDLSSIPANATIQSAQLVMYSDTIPMNGDLVHANYGADNSVLIQQAATTWDSSTLTWFNQPAGLPDNQVIVPSTAQPYLNINVNVKDMVSAMVKNNTNYGFKLQLQHEDIYTSRIFCSSYYSDATRHPRLIVKYRKN
jgi:hypothetical protein